MPKPKHCVSDFNGAVFEPDNEAPFFMGLFQKLLKNKLKESKPVEVEDLLKIEPEIKRRIHEYEQSLMSKTSTILEEKLRNQAEQLKVIYGQFNDRVVSDKLVTCEFVSDYTAKFAGKNHKKLYRDVLKSVHKLKTEGITVNILSSAYHREIKELLSESGYLPDFNTIIGNVLLTDDNLSSYDPNDPEKLFYFLVSPSESEDAPSESKDAKEFLLTINCDNKYEILRNVFFDGLSINPEETAYVGDSTPDIPCLESVGYPVVALPVAKKLASGDYDGVEPEFIEYCDKNTRKVRIASNKKEFCKALITG